MVSYEAQMRGKIETLARISLVFGQRELSVKAGKNILSCTSPMNNEGYPDEDYTVISVSGFEFCDLWVFKGKVNVDATMRNFESFGVTIAQLNDLDSIYKKVALKMKFLPFTYFYKLITLIHSRLHI